MNKARIATYLVDAPETVRRSMLDCADTLPPGAAAVVGRLFTAMRSRKEPLDAPGPAAFLEAATSESTLATLLRALAIHAPRLSTAAGRQLRKEFYKRRGPSTCSCSRRTIAPLPAIAPDDWPPHWRQLWPSLRSADIRDSSKRRYLASISRCAQMLPDLDLPAGVDPDRPGYFLGHSLAEAFARMGVSNRTIANYLDGLVGLMRQGNSDRQALGGLRATRDHFKGLGRSDPKLKQGRIRVLMEQGGFAFIIEKTAELCARAASLPGHLAEAERIYQTVAVLMILVNKPARTGEAALWRLGTELRRSPCGAWRLHWDQSKTDRETGAGSLWPETCQILDDLVLRGRPARLISLEYQSRIGMNWLTGTNETRSAGFSSQLVRDAIGVPAHDLRTLVADYLRFHDPATAPDIIQSHLGHGSKTAGTAYRALAEGDAAAASWTAIRRDLIQKSEPSINRMAK